jgi:hypothetical protein
MLDFYAHSAVCENCECYANSCLVVLTQMYSLTLYLCSLSLDIMQFNV